MSFILLGILNSQAPAGGNVEDLLSSSPVWFDAADSSTITESGGSVSQWDNKGTKANFVQSTSSDQPSTGVDTLNGLNVISFGSGDFLSAGTNTDWGFLHDGTNYFVATVISLSSSGVSRLGTTASFSENGVLVGNEDQDLEVFVTNSSGSSGSSAISINDANFFTYNTFQITTALFDPDNATAADRLEHFKNDGSGSKLNTNTGAPSTSATSDFAFRYDSTNLSSKVAEIIVVSGDDATEENRQRVLDYLNEKWGVF